MKESLPTVDRALEQLQNSGGARNLWERNGAWWSDDPAEQEAIANRLGWLPVLERMAAEAVELDAFADEVRRAGFKNVLVMGMGGSSLAPDLLSTAFEARAGYPEVYVVDSTDPAVIAMIRGALDPRETLYVVSSKSGSTAEPLAFFHYFWELVQKKKGDRAGESFVAITDPGTELLDLAGRHNFRRVFENPPDIGGRYSALSYFGLVPAALMGVDVGALLASALDMARRCGPDVRGAGNPGLWLGAVLGTFAREGRDKLTFFTSPAILAFADWAEQLIAESTGKRGAGIVPVAGEPPGPPEVYGDDRVFAYLRLAGDENDEVDAAAEQLIDAGFPVITLSLGSVHDLGAEFVRWEFATAVAGKVLGINPFDEPNVTESKNNTRALLEEYHARGRLPESEPDADEDAVEIYGGAGRTPAEPGLAGYLRALLDQLKPGDYFAILAYLDPSEENEAALQRLRVSVRDGHQVATTLGFGPRYLHSTGQLHKGGASNGVFLVITADEAGDVKIPGLGYSFGTLIRAQALGDLRSLRDRGRRLLWLHLFNTEEGLEQLGDQWSVVSGR